MDTQVYELYNVGHLRIVAKVIWGHRFKVARSTISILAEVDCTKENTHHITTMKAVITLITDSFKLKTDREKQKWIDRWTDQTCYLLNRKCNSITSPAKKICFLIILFLVNMGQMHIKYILVYWKNINEHPMSRPPAVYIHLMQYLRCIFM